VTFLRGAPVKACTINQPFARNNSFIIGDMSFRPFPQRRSEGHDWRAVNPIP